MRRVLYGLAILVAAQSAYAIPLSLGGSGTALIDGILQESEWSSAGTYNLSVNTSGGGTTDGRLYVMNDAFNIYFGLRFTRAAPAPGNTFAIEFDTDHSGGLSVGDDGILVNPNPSVGFSDLVRNTTASSCPGGTLCSSKDTELGGTLDGEGVFAHSGTDSVYELSHPLNSGDTNDIALSAGDSIGFSGFIRTIDASGTSDTRIDFGVLEFQVSPVPEPGSLLLLGIGLAGIGLARYRF